jgi:hypothetical protein
MKKIILASITAVIAFTLFFGTEHNTKTVYDPTTQEQMSSLITPTEGQQVAGKWVRGYTKKNGTYVAPYYRSTPTESYDKNGNYKY